MTYAHYFFNDFGTLFDFPFHNTKVGDADKKKGKKIETVDRAKRNKIIS